MGGVIRDMGKRAPQAVHVGRLAEPGASRYRSPGSDRKRRKIMGAFSLLLWFVPLGNIVGLWIFAFAEWPALKNPGQMRA
jgi:hypothetical protein